MHHSLTVSAPAGPGSRLAEAAREVARQADDLQQLGDDALPTLLALLATGAFPGVARVIRRLAPAADLPALAAAIGRYTAWSGDLGSHASLRHRTARLLDPAAPGTAPPRPAGAHDPASDQDAGAIVVAAGAMAGIERSATDHADPATAARAHAGLRPLRQALAAARLDDRHQLLADALGLDTLPATPGLPPGPAWLLLHFVHGVLGADPDATRHRLRLRPDLHGAASDSTALLPLRLDGLAFGDGAVSLSVATDDDGAISYRVEQDSGSIPATLLLEPVLPRPPRAAAVDGQVAELRPRPGHRGTILPVQLVLDAPRELRVWMDEGRPPGGERPSI